MEKQQLTYLNALAISCLAHGHLKEAEPAFELMANSIPDSSAGPVGLASVELARGNFEEAIGILQQSADKAQVNAGQIRKVLLNALVAADRIDEADAVREGLQSLNACLLYTSPSPRDS